MELIVHLSGTIIYLLNQIVHLSETIAYLLELIVHLSGTQIASGWLFHII